MPAPHIILNAFIYWHGHHEAAWRHPQTRDEDLHSIRHLHRVAQIAERGLLDAVFLADGPAFHNDPYTIGGTVAEPITTLASIAAVTEHIGLIATASTTYNQPYNLARSFASLDQVSAGRGGWNIVTTQGDIAARNFGLEAAEEKSQRYRRADEFVRVANLLWDSWQDDAIVADRQSGRYVDVSKVHPAEFEGEFYRVAGALNAPRSPQGRPVLVQAGSSDAGRAFAARHAEAIFTAQQRQEDAQAFRQDIRNQAQAIGRDPDSVKVLPGISAFLGSTEAEAQALERETHDLLVPERGLQSLSRFGLALELSDLDKPVPDAILEGAGAVLTNVNSRHQVIAGIVERDRPTARQLLERLASGRGHKNFTGTPEQLADFIETWVDTGAADGFNVMPPLLPSGLEIFVEHVVPILQRRGRFRTEYSGTTLRENLGLAVPTDPRHSTDQRVR